MRREENETTKFVHQSWKTADNVPKRYQKFVKNISAMVKRHEKNMCHVLWTDVCNERLVKTHYPDFHTLYTGLYTPVQRADLCRCFYLHRYGGLYLDLDSVVSGDIDVFDDEANRPSILVSRSDNIMVEAHRNNVMYSATKNHEFWLEYANNIKKAFEDKSTKFNKLLSNRLVGPFMQNLITIQLTGPGMLDKTMLLHENKESLGTFNEDFPVKESSDTKSSWNSPAADLTPVIILGVMTTCIFLVVGILVGHFAI